MSPDWNEEDGGHLCLFNSDPEKNHPIEIVKRILPQENLFSLFRVQNNSWHSVSEVLTPYELEEHKMKYRLSINGWFHYSENAVVPFGPGPAPDEPLPRLRPTLEITVRKRNNLL